MKNITVFILTILVIISFFIGKNMYPKQVLYGDIFSECKDKNGVVNIDYSIFHKKYEVVCKTSTEIISDYYINY